MEEKIVTLIYLAKEFNETEEEDVSFSIAYGSPAIYVMGVGYVANTYEEALDKAIKTIQEWIEEEKAS